MKKRYSLTVEEYALLQAAKRLPEEFGLAFGKLVIPRDREAEAQVLLDEVVRRAWVVHRSYENN
jgi:hypothetical protein